MDLRDLRYFETIAELQHLGRAAERLHRSQPALSSSIRRLEADCGAALFEKSGRGIRLTQAGTVLLKWAQRMRHDLDDARRELSSIGTGLTGHVRLGIVPTAAQFLLPPVARQLLGEAPGVTLHTAVGLVDTLRPRLRAGELDLLVGTDSGAEPGHVSRLLAEDRIVVAASERHPVFDRPSATLADLGAWSWALQPPGQPTRDWLDHTFDRQGLPRPHVQVESTSLMALPTLIEQTGLLSFISRHHLQGEQRMRGLKEVPVRGATMRRRLVVTWRDGAYLSPATQRLVELLLRSSHGEAALPANDGAPGHQDAGPASTAAVASAPPRARPGGRRGPDLSRP